MNKCNFCKVNIVDDAVSCPLCGGALESLTPSDNTYPNVLKKTRVINLIFRILLFIGIISSVVSIMLNYYFNFSYKSSLIVAVSFLYALFVVFLFTKEGSGYRLRTFGGVVGGVLLVIFIDSLYDLNHWSFDYVLPGAILALNLFLIIIMCINRRNWQSYILLLGGVFLSSCVLLLLCFIEIIKVPIFSQITFVICLLTLVGVLILGGPRVTQELRRRFYIR